MVGKGRGGSVAWCQQPAAVLIYTKRSQACNATRAAKQGGWAMGVAGMVGL